MLTHSSNIQLGRKQDVVLRSLQPSRAITFKSLLSNQLTLGNLNVKKVNPREYLSGRSTNVLALRDCKKFARTWHLSVHICLSVLVVISLWSQCSARTSRDKTPLLVTDDGDGFRYFLRHDEELDEEFMGRSAPSSLIYTDHALDFQTLKHIKEWGNDSDILLVSGRNHVYMLETRLIGNQPEITYRERLTWSTPTHSRNECIMMPGQPVELCENFIRFIELLDNGELMVCGTNAYSPSCRYYTREQFDEPLFGEESDYNREAKCRGQCVVPYNPTTASAALYTNTDNGYQIFAAVINDFMSNNPIIMRKDQPTLLSNSLWLKDPTFIKIMEYEDKVYVFFRETAKQSESGTTEKVIYGRVARICKNDPGGVNVLAQQWTSFLKARLRCGNSNEQHLEFNNMTSVSDIMTIPDMPEGHSEVIFATFTTPWQWSDASLSAVCAFSLKDISKVFDEGRFFGEYEIELKPLSRQINSMSERPPEQYTEIINPIRSYPIEEDAVPSPRPGGCSLVRSPNVLYFAKKHPLMYDDILPLFSSPIYVTHNNLRATEVAVDNNAGGSGKLMIYLGTEDGKVLRLRGMVRNKMQRAVLIESITVGKREKCEAEGCSIRSLHVSRPLVDGISLEPSIFVSFTDYMVQLPLARCHAYKTKKCCSIDPDCGWNVDKCVRRTSRNSMLLSPTSKDTDSLPEFCNTPSFGPEGPMQKCECDVNCAGKTKVPGSSLVIDQEILDLIDGDDTELVDADLNFLNLRDILGDSISPGLEKQFADTLTAVREGEQRIALEKQLKEAVESTVDLVLRNHRQEYCLPSPAVNHLTHVYPLLLRQIETWHESALKKLTPSVFDAKCWSVGESKCTERVSFSLPLDPMLWEPLTKLIINFSGECHVMDAGGRHAASFRPKPKSQCAPLPGLESCTDVRQPHCAAKRCVFPKYTVDVKAFFRHANDSRHFLKYGNHIEPLWKPVNITIPNGESIRGHLELTVSDSTPFIIDYSPVAEKVKIRFHYSPVRDCALTDPVCVGAVHGCDLEVEHIVDHWFKWIMRKMSHRMRKCPNEINKGKKKDSRMLYGRHDRHHTPVAVDGSDWIVDERKSDWNTIPMTPNKCKRVVGRVKPLSSHPPIATVWSLIVSRCQKAGGVYSVPRKAIEFRRLQEVLHFFKNTCTFEEASLERQTFRKRTSRGHSRAPVYIQPMVTPDTPFVIERFDTSNKIVMKFYTMEG